MLEHINILRKFAINVTETAIVLGLGTNRKKAAQIHLIVRGQNKHKYGIDSEFTIHQVAPVDLFKYLGWTEEDFSRFVSQPGV